MDEVHENDVERHLGAELVGRCLLLRFEDRWGNEGHAYYSRADLPRMIADLQAILAQYELENGD